MTKHGINLKGFIRQFQINTTLGGFPDFSSDKHSVVFKGNYVRENTEHKILLGYILYNKIGIEIICDATDETFSKVESDFNKIIKSLRIIE